jgi:hypothetical protein
MYIRPVMSACLDVLTLSYILIGAPPSAVQLAPKIPLAFRLPIQPSCLLFAAPLGHITRTDSSQWLCTGRQSTFAHSLEVSLEDGTGYASALVDNLPAN